MDKNSKKWSTRNLTIRVTNRMCGRVDIHKNISREEADWIAISPNLEVEVLDAKSFRDRNE